MKPHGIPRHYKGAHLRRFHPHLRIPGKNCVAYHFRESFGHLEDILSEKEKSREYCGSLLYRFETRVKLVRFRVVLVFVDASAHVVGFLIELALILLRQMAVVLRHVFLFVALQPLLATLQTLGFSRR